MHRTATYQQLQKVIRGTGCPICRLGLAAVKVYLDTMMWESSTDVNVHEMMTASVGFCGRHSRELLSFGGQRLAAAVLERAALLAAQKRLPELVEGMAEPTQRLSHRLLRVGVRRDGFEPWSRPANMAPCPVCVRQAAEEQRGIDELLAHWDELEAPLLAAGGLCLPHLLTATAAASDVQQRKLLLLQDRVWTALYDDLEAFIRQHKQHHHGEPISDRERVAVERTIAGLTGEYPVR